LGHREREALAYLIEENRLLRRQLGGLRLTIGDVWLSECTDRVVVPWARSPR
jgi:hypothetical protein